MKSKAIQLLETKIWLINFDLENNRQTEKNEAAKKRELIRLEKLLKKVNKK